MPQISLSQLRDGAHIHFVGIGGISMSGLAEIMLKRGFNVSGSDRQKSHITNRLESNGATIFEGHDSSNIIDAELVVYTAAAKSDNPELVAAKEKGILTLNRAQFLGALMREYENVICIAGTHGKTTTTSILTHALLEADTDATVSIGGELDLINGNIRAGGEGYFLAEACEYTNSFLNFCPTVAVITNIEADHLDFFSSLDEIIESFKKFAQLTLNKGCVIACGDDENVRKALSDADTNTHYYGLSKDNEYYADNIVYNGGFPEFDVLKSGNLISHLTLSVPGEHNILNAIATIAVCDILGLDIDKSTKGISTFKGAHRRFEIKGTVNGATIIDDYAHHPTEISATLSSAKKFQSNKLWCVFQPHTYSRTRTLWNDFLTCFDLTDELIITEIYAAREQFDGITKAETLADEIKKRGISARYIKTFDEIENILRAELKHGDILFTMGAGNVVEIGENLCK